MSKLLRKAVSSAKRGRTDERNGGKADRSRSSPSSREQRPPAMHLNDEEVARALHKEMNAGDEPDLSTQNQTDDSAYPDEIENSLIHVQKFAKDALSTTCHKCENALIEKFDVAYWLGRWKKGGFSTGVKCACGAITCLGCADKVQVGNSKYMGEYEGMNLDWCCYKGGAFIAWVLLCWYDSMELNMQATKPQVKPTAKRDRKNGVGFGANIRSQRGAMEVTFGPDGKFHYRAPGLPQALNFKQVDTKTDGMTSWVLGMLILILPKKEETTKKVSPALAAMIELSLLQDRTAQLLRNDSLQDADKRADLYFAVFEFVNRLFHHPSLDHLVKEDRFMKKQSAGLHAISTDWKGKGKTKATTSLTVAPRSQGMGSSLIACMNNLATQSKVLLSGSHNKAAGADILEIAEGIQKLYNRLAPPTEKLATITTWKEYLQAHAVTRKPDVAKRLCAYSAEQARDIKNSPKNRMARLVTETSEMTTSLPENVFVIIDEVRPDIMKALIIGPKGTPYEGGLFEFDIVCGEKYPAEPPDVQIVTTGFGKVKFNPNLYANGKVCLSLLGTWPGGPETKWQPHKSTIASVLVSIQAMILVEHPLENEPALENIRSTPRGAQDCIGYNNEWRSGTLKYATLHWLTMPEMRNGLWKGVVNDYFRFCGRGVVESARRWEKELRRWEKKFGRPPTKITEVVHGKMGILSDEIEKAIKRYVK
ncbi:MAG: hypothetical protein Q9192_006487 [Flavoplaca navasiana]